MMGGLSAVTDAIPGIGFWDALGHSPSLTATQLNGAVLTVTHGAITGGMGAQTLTMVFKIRGTAKTFTIIISVQF